MIYIYKFNINGYSFKIKSSDLIDSEGKSAITNFINNVHKNINHNIEGSYAYAFNSLPKGSSATTLSEDFMEFLKYNIRFTKSYPNKFKPFLPIKTNEDIFGSINIDGNLLEKIEDVALDTSHIRKPFLIDQISNFLKNTLLLNNFLIESENYFISVGLREWIVSYPEIPGTFGISDVSIYYDEYVVEDYPESKLNNTILTITSDNSCVNKIEFMNLPSVNKFADLRQYCDENNLKVTVMNKKGAIASIGF
jgi:hypothetical protein